VAQTSDAVCGFGYWIDSLRIIDQILHGQATDDVTWPWKVKLVTPIRLTQYLENGYGVESVDSPTSPFQNNHPPIEHGLWLWGIKRSRD